MNEFIVTGPDGKRYRVSGDSAEGAASAVAAMLGNPMANRVASARAGTLQASPDSLARAAQADAIADPAAAIPEGMVFDPATNQYVDRGLMASQMQPSRGRAFQVGGGQGVTLGGADELVGAVRGPEARQRSLAELEAARRDYPLTTLAGEVVGAVTNAYGVGKAVGPVIGAGANLARGTALGATMAGAPTTATVAGAAAKALSAPQTLGTAVLQGGALGAGYGAASGALTAESGERAEGAETGAKVGALFGAVAPIAVNVGTKAFRAIFGRAVERPSVESLRAAKTVAYRAVDDAGETFAPQDIANLRDRAISALDDLNFIPDGDPQTAAALKVIGKVSDRGQPVSIGQLDKVRQSLWDRYSRSREVGILAIIDEIDTLVQSRASTSELMDAARLANSQYKKAELLDVAFRNAELGTAATGSGGNILNKYRQAVASILRNKKQAKWFGAEEIAAMENFVRGNLPENVLRRIGKLSPSGNGLMMALNIGAIAAEPMMATATVAGAAAKGASDRMTARAAENLIGRVATGGAPPVRPVDYGINALSGVAGYLGGR